MWEKHIESEREREREDVSFLVRERVRETTVKAFKGTKLIENLKNTKIEKRKKIGFRFEKDGMKEWGFVL